MLESPLSKVLAMISAMHACSVSTKSRRAQGYMTPLKLPLSHHVYCRFGVGQRAALEQLASLAPHMLSLGATPIPRTLELMQTGHLSFYAIDELPPGRMGVQTHVLPDSKSQVKRVSICFAIGQDPYYDQPQRKQHFPLRTTVKHLLDFIFRFRSAWTARIKGFIGDLHYVLILFHADV